jgi:hypothetical protein
MRSRVRGLGGAGAHGGWLRTGTAINWHLRVGGGAIPSSSSSACALAVRQSVMLSRILGIRCASGSWEFPANDGIQCGLHRVDTVPAFKPPVENPKSSGPINLDISHFFTYTVHQRAASSPQFADSSGLESASFLPAPSPGYSCPQARRPSQSPNRKTMLGSTLQSSFTPPSGLR